MIATVIVPLVTKSADNGREHPMVRHKRVKRERRLTALFARTQLDLAAWARLRKAGARVDRMTLTRLAPRPLDVGNLPGSMKAVQDEMCALMGLDDSVRGGIDWRYAQEKAAKGKEAVRVDLEMSIPAQKEAGSDG